MKDNVLLGRWRVPGIYRDRGAGYVLSDRLNGREGFVWEFCEDGRLVEYCGPDGDYESQYSYAPDEQKLHTQALYKQVESVKVFEYDCFRVEIISSEEIWLYHFEDLTSERENYAIRLLKCSKKTATFMPV